MFKLGLPRLPMPKGPQVPRGIGQFNPFGGMPRPFEGGMAGPFKGNGMNPMPMPMPFEGGFRPGLPMPHPPIPFGGMPVPMKPNDIRSGMNPFQFNPLMNFGRQVQRY